MDLFLMSLEYPNLVTCMFKILYYSINFREQEITFFFISKTFLSPCPRCLGEFGSLFSSYSYCCFRDLSWNQLRGPIPSSRFASNITTMYKTSLADKSYHLIILLIIWLELSFIDRSNCINSDSWRTQFMQWSFP